MAAKSFSLPPFKYFHARHEWHEVKGDFRLKLGEKNVSTAAAAPEN